MDLPSYAELPVRPGAPAGSSWGLWGDDDRLGALNLLTPERARRGAECVLTGIVHPLDLDLRLPDPPLFGRPALHLESVNRGVANDDVLHGFNTQSSTQWDGFRHFGAPEGFYNGLAGDQHGVLHWAEHGLAGRGVLVDVDRWRRAQGRPIQQGEREPITVEDLTGCLRAQGTALETGDVLLLRTGWLTWYLALDRDQRPGHGDATPTNPGLVASTEMAAFLWDSHVAAVAADNPALEMWPPRRDAMLHPHLLGLLGIPIGELFALDDLAEDCAAAGSFDMLVTSAPLHLPGGAASPPNMLAVR